MSHCEPLAYQFKLCLTPNFKPYFVYFVIECTLVSTATTFSGGDLLAPLMNFNFNINYNNPIVFNKLYRPLWTPSLLK